MTKNSTALMLLTAFLSATASAAGDRTLMLHQPTVSKDHIAFVYSGDLWIADRQGGHPQQLTTSGAAEFNPRFSPDGRWIAYSATFDGNTDVYVISTSGGAPRRLTWHPGADVVSGWSVDGKRVLFTSARDIGNSRSRQFFEVSTEGGFEKKVMSAVAVDGVWSPDGKRLAYQPYGTAFAGASGWRQHRGGDTPPIWIIDPATDPAKQTWEKLPHVNASDTNPRWAGNELVFISDRNDGAANLFAYNSATKAVRQLTHETVWDVRSADVEGGNVVYEVGGRLKSLSLGGGEPQTLDIHLDVSGPQARTQWKDAGKTMTSAVLSATAKRVIVTARGEVFSVPVKDGSTRNITGTDGVREDGALGSPDGQQIAYLSEAGSGMSLHHVLMLRKQDGLEPPRVIALKSEGYFKLLAWSPDGKTLALNDNHLNTYVLDVASGSLSRIDTSDRRDESGDARVSFSPDGRWLAYTVMARNYFRQLRLYDVVGKRVVPVSDGLSSVTSPAFSPKGDVLYFASSNNAGQVDAGIDMSSQDRPRRAGLFALVLSGEGKSPLAPKAGDEEGKKADDKKADDNKSGDKKADKKEGGKPDAELKPVRIDIEGLQQRINPLPVPERNYDALAVASDGALFYLDQPQPGATGDAPGRKVEATTELVRFDFESKKAKTVKTDVTDFSLSADGKKLLARSSGDSLELGDASEKFEGKPVPLIGLQMRVNPRNEWRQIFDEAWWMEREYFYDPKLHGLDASAVYQRYLPLLASVQRREDLTELIVNMIAELQVGHNRSAGGDGFSERPVKVGLLGADFALEQGKLRIVKILQGDRWNPFLSAPLAATGLGVKVGDYLLAINEMVIDAEHGNLYELLADTVGQQVTLTVADDAAGKNRRHVVVVPVDNEAALRHWDWLEHSRQYVDKQSGGRIAYVYMPDTQRQGFLYFDRMFAAQSDKPALIVDERRNGGGQIANYVIETLRRTYLMGAKDRDGAIISSPQVAIYGPKAMLIDQDAGSGGDIMPYLFRQTGLGPLIGTRTWGGVIGIAVNPRLIDGGMLTVPYVRLFSPEGKWVIENQGVAPDLDVELDPTAVNKGQDPQLDAAIQSVLERLKTAPALPLDKPPAMPGRLGD